MNKVVEIISQEIAQRGAISFARFMELALYCPVHGYYEQEQDKKIGRRGGYYTSVSVGMVFGELLAYQIAEWLEEIDGFRIVEAGAHDGRLAADILTWFATCRPKLLERFEYWIVEPSLKRRQWQEQTLKEFTRKVHWVEKLPGEASIAGVIFSNELLDSFPVHRLTWEAQGGRWLECGVSEAGGKFVWTRLPLYGSISAKREFPPPDLQPLLPDGFTIEISPAAEHWWRTACNSLLRGKIMTIDYGLTGEEMLNPGRKDGTLRAYHAHTVTSELLDCPGEQDLTAHVNFSDIQAAGEAEDLTTDTFVTQEQFLTQIVAKLWSTSRGWSSAQFRQFQTLTHPEHLGRQFRVLVQSRSS